jgi:hypothetical protein
MSLSSSGTTANDESLSSSNSSLRYSSTNTTPNSLFKTPSQAPLAPAVVQQPMRPFSETNSAAARFVSSLSETQLQSMLSDLLVEKNALLKVILLALKILYIR